MGEFDNWMKKKLNERENNIGTAGAALVSHVAAGSLIPTNTPRLDQQPVCTDNKAGGHPVANVSQKVEFSYVCRLELSFFFVSFFFLS